MSTEATIQTGLSEGPLNVGLLESSFHTIAPQADEFVKTFYEELFYLYPEVKELFGHVEMASQRKKLIAALVLVMENLRRPASLESALLNLGRKHQGYDVVAKHYPLVGEALLNTLATFLSSQWTAELEEAWKAAYGVIAETMLKGYSRRNES
jgi:nitric oxide dioxygenase